MTLNYYTDNELLAELVRREQQGEQGEPVKAATRAALEELIATLRAGEDLLPGDGGELRLPGGEPWGPGAPGWRPRRASESLAQGKSRCIERGVLGPNRHLGFAIERARTVAGITPHDAAAHLHWHWHKVRTVELGWRTSAQPMLQLAECVRELW